MGYLLKRYTGAVRTRKAWLLLALVFLALYLAYAAFTNRTYRLSQDFRPYTASLPVAVASSPVATERLEALVAHPERLFLESFAIAQLRERVALLEETDALAGDSALRRLVHASMALSAPEPEVLRLSYTGSNRSLGEVMLGFYAERLLQRISAGADRTARAAGESGGLAAGGLVIESHVSPWSPDRWLPALLVLALSLLAILAAIGVAEALDPSFKSERQVARYLNVPVLGTLPDAGPLLEQLPESEEAMVAARGSK